MENFDHELFEVDEQIRALDEYDTSNDEDDKIDIKYEDLDDDIVTFNVSEPGPPPAKVARKSSPSKSAAKHPKKLTKRRGHLDPEDVQALEKERGFRMELRGTKGKEGGRKKKVYNYICLTCGYQCKHLSGATDHVNVEHRKVPLECTECDYVTFRWKNISHHRLKFHKLKGMSCPVEGCNFTGGEKNINYRCTFPK